MAHVRMTSANRTRGSIRRGVAVPLGVLAILLLVAAPALGAQGPTKLEQPLVSPTAGTTATTITLEVTYRNHSDKAPQYVRVSIGSSVHDMTAVTSTSWRDGVRFRWTGKLPVGTYAIQFEASDFEKFVDQLPAGTVTIAAPPPPPPPSPSPTPDPGSGPAPAPGAGGGTTSPGGSTTRPGSVIDPGAGDDGLGGTSDPTDDGRGGTVIGAAPAGWLTGGGDGSGGSTGGSDPDGSGGDGSGDGGSVDGSATGGDPLFPPVAPGTGVGFFVVLTDYLHGVGADPVAALLPGGGGTQLPLVASAVGSTAAVGVWMAFSLFGKRRRDEEMPASAEALQAAAAAGLGLVPSSGLVPELADPELLMPRWRRPSLLEARKHDPIRDGTGSRPALSFGYDTATTNERRLIRYATVRLLDRPDEVMGIAVGDLGAGDEVELCERSGLFWFVRAPDGRAGWLHRMTLGDQVSPGVRASA